MIINLKILKEKLKNIVIKLWFFVTWMVPWLKETRFRIILQILANLKSYYKNVILANLKYLWSCYRGRFFFFFGRHQKDSCGVILIIELYVYNFIFHFIYLYHYIFIDFIYIKTFNNQNLIFWYHLYHISRFYHGHLTYDEEFEKIRS